MVTDSFTQIVIEGIKQQVLKSGSKKEAVVANTEEAPV
jgi:hypothetical protein